MSNRDRINVVYDKMTGRVIIYECDGNWVMPSHLELAHYENGLEPVIDETDSGDLYLRPNTVLIKNLFEI